jgi:hypothetical protein
MLAAPSRPFARRPRAISTSRIRLRDQVRARMNGLGATGMPPRQTELHRIPPRSPRAPRPLSQELAFGPARKPASQATASVRSIRGCSLSVRLERKFIHGQRWQGPLGLIRPTEVTSMPMDTSRPTPLIRPTPPEVHTGAQPATLCITSVCPALSYIRPRPAHSLRRTDNL